MADHPSERVTCPGCGKGYRWQDQLVGRAVACKQCDASFTVPDTPGIGVMIQPDPATADGLYELDLGEKDLPRQLANPSVGGKCPSCNSPVKDHAVLCMNCGFNMQAGTQMAKPQVSELSRKERKESGKNAYAPIKGMVWVRVGLWMNLLSILLMMASIPVAFFNSTQAQTLLDVLAYSALGLSSLGSLLCLAAPKESGARPVLIASIALSVCSIIGTLAYNSGNISDVLFIAADLLGIAGTACFLYFFVMLAKHLGFEEITANAQKVFGLYLLCSLGAYLLILPFIGCFLVFAILGASLYAAFLYVMLLIDLSNALSYRISEQR